MINCSVKTCNHNDQDNHCTLQDITVGCTTSSPHTCRDTECDSFEECK